MENDPGSIQLVFYDQCTACAATSYVPLVIEAGVWDEAEVRCRLLRALKTHPNGRHLDMIFIPGEVLRVPPENVHELTGITNSITEAWVFP